jgi:hypothetical protein
MNIDIYLHLNKFAFMPVFVCVFNLKLQQTLVRIQIQIEKQIEIKKRSRLFDPHPGLAGNTLPHSPWCCSFLYYPGRTWRQHYTGMTSSKQINRCSIHRAWAMTCGSSPLFFTSSPGAILTTHRKSQACNNLIQVESSFIKSTT